MDAAGILRRIGERDPAVVELALRVCLASRIEPVLLRKARLAYLPRTSGDLEGKLWFSTMVRSRNSRSITLLPEVAAILRSRLAEDAVKLDAAYALVRETHSYLPPLARLEDELIYTTIRFGHSSPGERELQRLAGPALRALTGPGRLGVARWAQAITARLPDNQSAALHLLGHSAKVRLGDTPKLQDIESRLLTDSEREFLASLAVPIDAGVRFVKGGLELSEPPLADAPRITLPDTEPRTLDVSDWDRGQRRRFLVRWGRGERLLRILPVIDSTVVIKTASGGEYEIALDIPRVRIPRTEPVPPLLYALIDRESQAETLRDVLSRHDRRYPALFVVHGKQGQEHGALLSRFEQLDLPRLNSRGVPAIARFALNWPARPADAPAFTEHLRRGLAEATFNDRNASIERIVASVRDLNLMLTYHCIDRDCDEPQLNWFTAFWAQWPELPRGSSVSAFLSIKYSPKNTGLLARFQTSPANRVRRWLERPYSSKRLPYVLPELSDITLADLRAWLERSEVRPFVKDPAAAQARSYELWRSQESLPMIEGREIAVKVLQP